MDRLTQWYSGGLLLDVRDDGPEDGEPVLLLHGFPQDGTSWDRVVPGLHDAEADGAQAATGAETGKGAAAAAGETPGPVPGVPNSGMPRMKPPVHADRYSPGSTPSAEDLTPGAPKL